MALLAPAIQRANECNFFRFSRHKIATKSILLDTTRKSSGKRVGKTLKSVWETQGGLRGSDKLGETCYVHIRK